MLVLPECLPPEAVCCEAGGELVLGTAWSSPSRQEVSRSLREEDRPPGPQQPGAEPLVPFSWEHCKPLSPQLARRLFLLCPLCKRELGQPLPMETFLEKAQLVLSLVTEV